MSRKLYRDLTPDQRARSIAASRRWQEKNREKFRAAQKGRQRRGTLRKYGLTEADWEKLLQIVRGICPICRAVPPTCMDHDHSTGKVRLPTCRSCNVMLGFAKDNPDVLRRAAAYLELFR